MWNLFKKKTTVDDLIYLPLTTEQKEAKDYVLKFYPDADAHAVNMYWPGQRERRLWIITLRSTDSMPHGSGKSEAEAWNVAAQYVSFKESEKRIQKPR